MRTLLPLTAVAAAVAVAGIAVLAATWVDDGRPGAAAVTPATAASSLPPGHPSPAGEEAAAAAPVGDTLARSIRRLEKTLAADPDDHRALLELGDAYFLQRDYDLAGRAYEGVLRLRPDDPTATVRLAMVWHAAGRPRRAMAAIEEALAAHPDDQEAHYSLAIVYFSEERLAEAREQWLAAARIDPRSELGRRSQSFVDLLDGDEPGESSGDG